MIRPCSSSVPGSSDQVIITFGGITTWPSALTRNARSITSTTAAMSRPPAATTSSWERYRKLVSGPGIWGMIRGCACRDHHRCGRSRGRPHGGGARPGAGSRRGAGRGLDRRAEPPRRVDPHRRPRAARPRAGVGRGGDDRRRRRGRDRPLPALGRARGRPGAGRRDPRRAPSGHARRADRSAHGQPAAPAGAPVVGGVGGAAAGRADRLAGAGHARRGRPRRAGAGHRRRGRRRDVPRPDRPRAGRRGRGHLVGAVEDRPGARAGRGSAGVVYTDPEWPEQVGEIDVAVDSAGGPAWEGIFRCLRVGGTLVSFGDTMRETARASSSPRCTSGSGTSTARRWAAPASSTRCSPTSSARAGGRWWTRCTGSRTPPRHTSGWARPTGSARSSCACDERRPPHADRAVVRRGRRAARCLGDPPPPRPGGAGRAERRRQDDAAANTGGRARARHRHALDAGRHDRGPARPAAAAGARRDAWRLRRRGRRPRRPTAGGPARGSWSGGWPRATPSGRRCRHTIAPRRRSIGPAATAGGRAWSRSPAGWGSRPTTSTGSSTPSRAAS